MELYWCRSEDKGVLGGEIRDQDEGDEGYSLQGLRDPNGGKAEGIMR